VVTPSLPAPEEKGALLGFCLYRRFKKQGPGPVTGGAGNCSPAA
jgi:hypothetical protein